ncbi:MAG TPA: squalene/phytoene synthase family protein [Streptosporangiaceae bacterium]|nr:squalene/phytoene synthase family protein [Streptosporangiaceae bacterium]
MTGDGRGVVAGVCGVAATLAQAGEENFPVALRLLPARYRYHLLAVYLFARTVDDVGDRAPVAQRQQLLADLEADLRLLYAPVSDTAAVSRAAAVSQAAAAGTSPGAGPVPGTSMRPAPTSPAVRGLAATIADRGIPMQPFIDLIEANRQDQLVTRYETFDDLLGYCRLSANPVGRIVLHIFGAFSAERAARSDSVCTGLQLAEHWQDVAEDLRAGRVYLPGQDLRAYGCTERDLAGPPASPRLRELMKFEVGRARSQLDAGAPLIGSLRGAARFAVAGYVAGGRAALAAIEAVGYDVLSATPRPRRGRTAAELLLAVARGR